MLPQEGPQDDCTRLGTGEILTLHLNKKVAIKIKFWKIIMAIRKKLSLFNTKICITAENLNHE